MTTWEPNITAFLCNWCTYGAADLAGVSRLEHPPNIRIIKLPCSGRVSPKFILSAFRQGADGVWVSGCHPGDCHYIEGNFYARRKFALFKSLIEHMGIEFLDILGRSHEICRCGHKRYRNGLEPWPFPAVCEKGDGSAL